MAAIDQRLKGIVVSAQGEDIRLLEGRFAGILSENPVDLNALYGRGMLCWRTGRKNEAVEFIDKVLKNLPDNSPEIIEIRFLLAQILFDLKNFEHASLHAQYLIDRKIYHPVAYIILCHSLREMGDFSRARKFLKEGIRGANGVIEYQPGLVPLLGKDERRIVDGITDYRSRRDASLSGGDLQVLMTWAPLSITQTGAELKGAAMKAGSSVTPVFELMPKDKLCRDAPLYYEALPVGTCCDSAEAVQVWRAFAQGLEPGRDYRYRLILRDEKGGIEYGGFQSFSTKVFTVPDIITGGATPAGLGGVVVNGSIGGTNLPTSFFFRYGSAHDRLDRSTLLSYLPSPRTAITRDIISHRLDHIIPYTLEAEFPGVEPPMHVQSDPAIPLDLALRLTTPFGKDRNHVDGIGAADLVMGWWSIAENPDEPSGDYPGRTVDLRDAEVDITICPRSMDCRGSYFSLCCQSSLGTACTDHMEDTSNWCLTGQISDVCDLADGQWHSLRYDLRNNSEQWTYAGNNPEEQGQAAGRYAYRHIGDVLSRHRGNICFWFVFGNERDTCDGELDLYSLSLRYRDGSLLSKGWDARLISWPGGSVIDPGRLTDGWRGDPDHFWLSGPDPDSPQEFLWDFGKNVEIETARLHQHPLYPSKDVSLSGSMDGEFFEPIMEMILPSGKGLEAANNRTFCILDLPATVRYLKLSLHSGYQPEFWGLDAIEVFGIAGPPNPEVEPCSVSDELGCITPGETLYYQLVAENALGRVAGEILSAFIPLDCRPTIQWARVIKKNGNAITIMVRLTAMGQRTELNGIFENSNGEVIRGPVLDAGCQKVPRHMTYLVALPDSWDEWSCELRASNIEGESVTALDSDCLY